MSTISVRLDDRLRLAGALLAAGSWPEKEQAVKAYMAHRVADAAHKHFAPHAAHPAVQAALALVGEGEGLSRLYSHALNEDWPASLPTADFAAAADVAAFWEDTAAAWQEAEADAREVVSRASLGQFLADLLGPQSRALVFVPNLLFPGRQAVGAASAAEAVIALNPPIAWGSSHPWRYKERPDEVLARLSEAFTAFLFAQNLPEAHAGLRARADLFGLAGAVLFLREAEGEAAGDQFMVMEKKTRGFKSLPAVVTALEPLLGARRAGQTAGLADYLPQIAPALA